MVTYERRDTYHSRETRLVHATTGRLATRRSELIAVAHQSELFDPLLDYTGPKVLGEEDDDN